MAFTFERLALPEVILVQPKCFPDARGFFMETYKYSDFAAFGITDRFVQDNHTRSKKGALRGLHYQNPPKAQTKLVRVAHGEIFDVAVDIRKNSPTYGRWVGVLLSSENQRILYIPTGFAHGFCTLTDEADVLYKTTDEYSAQHEAGIIWNDPKIGIDWPIPQPIVSAKDAQLPSLEAAVNGFVYAAGGPR
jgi:dTDP-4-dehydrorhamnose 3,5-epimerase